jgi:anhydro-N-acetylmuramic acid kinase
MINCTKLALGLMSGTSLDGVDAALLHTDGVSAGRPIAALTMPYPDELREGLRAILGGQGAVAEIERQITLFHAEVAGKLLDRAGNPAIDLVGFHGHTILHRPDQRRTWQIGDGALLAELLGVPVINDFRSADVAAGGQGAPLIPVFHGALAGAQHRPLAMLNIGGVANVTWIGPQGELLAFDTGPGNALIDDWLLRHHGNNFDQDGRIAASGQVQQVRVERFLAHPYFAQTPPKSLDRDDFRQHSASLVADLGVADGAATLTAFTCAAIGCAARWFPAPATSWLVCGGGRHNQTLMTMLAAELPVEPAPIDSLGWDGDALEAQGFAYLAVRSLYGLPLSWPGTTGVAEAKTGGKLHLPPV